MVASGDVLRFVDGSEFRITKAAADTNGEDLELEWWLPPSTETPPKHIHPHQREDYEVLEGAFEVFVRDSWRTLGAGESASAPVGEVHTFRVGDRAVRVSERARTGAGAERAPRSGGVVLAAEDVQRDIGLVAHHPAVVAGRHVEEVSGSHDDLGTVVHLRYRLTAEYESHVLNLARVFAGRGTDVL
jgi:mannose-6-phosphate isomerase-like protein (cupin superfamily)